MNYTKISKFLSVAKASSSYPEFMMEAVFRGKADVGTKEFCKNYIMPLIYDFNDEKDNSGIYDYVDHELLKTKLLRELYSLPWLNDYIDAKRNEQKTDANKTAQCQFP